MDDCQKDDPEQEKINKLVTAVNMRRFKDAEGLIKDGVPCDKPDGTYKMSALQRCNWWLSQKGHSWSLNACQQEEMRNFKEEIERRSTTLGQPGGPGGFAIV